MQSKYLLKMHSTMASCKSIQIEYGCLVPTISDHGMKRTKVPNFYLNSSNDMISAIYFKYRCQDSENLKMFA